MKKYDVIIIGAGPAGIFAALELAKIDGLKVAIIDKGSDIEDRVSAPKRSLLSGWGGAAHSPTGSSPSPPRSAANSMPTSPTRNSSA